MRPARSALRLRLTLALGLALVGSMAVGWASPRPPIYVSSWAVRVSQGYQEIERLARKFGFVNLGPIFPDGQYFHLRHRGVVQQSLTPHWGHRLRLKKDPKVQWFQQQTMQRRVKRSLVVPTDPWFSKQWYMNKEVQPDLNILQVWSQGLSGQGIVVSVLDDGIEKDHPDLWANYDPLASYDFNDYDPDPQPRYTPSDENRHGTRCAGEVAATANNRFCGAGVAYNARIGGVRMLDGTITDVIEAQSLSLQPQHIHIYSASWGPEDDGRTVDGPGILTQEAFRRGVTKSWSGLCTWQGATPTVRPGDPPWAPTPAVRLAARALPGPRVAPAPAAARWSKEAGGDAARVDPRSGAAEALSGRCWVDARDPSALEPPALQTEALKGKRRPRSGQPARGKRGSRRGGVQSARGEDPADLDPRPPDPAAARMPVCEPDAQFRLGSSQRTPAAWQRRE
ncbi:proprotein convertase subtilisin/kexin type 4 [Physeter macrocephalus]|uniref:Proprotein convertase subtilisin/kexin type 4 n=1 Tax=Physeter macrocephalus TaxID=9755 RepID=A0A455BU09_PHYMC|nr:proprotein convertase subtilisin/kexin type 4-like [Physeter catodon]|eukprot:XP_028352474.1 proprotein convertase subtilisin/kexin type 4-like [Physeter catodon]